MENFWGERTADQHLYNNKSWFDEPKEYYTLVLTDIAKKLPSPNSLLDIGCANGAFLFHAQTALVGTKLYGAEPLSDLANLAKKYTSAEITEAGLFEFPENRKYEIVTMLGVLGIFFDIAEVLAKLKKCMAPQGAIYIHSSFNEENIDVILKYRRAPSGPWEIGHNLFSKKTIESVCETLGMKCEWIDFTLSKSIPKTDDPMRMWTESFRGNKYYPIYGNNTFVDEKLLCIRSSTDSW